jgi:hypothetical protein
MNERIGLPAATELGRGERGHVVIGRAKMRVLAGQHQVRPDAAMEERFGERCELYGFWTRTGDERNVLIVQPSPYLGAPSVATGKLDGKC